jgi:hypothetical protein
VAVLSAPDERGITRLLSRLDRALFRSPGSRRHAGEAPNPLPLAGRKLYARPDWRAT